MTDLSLKDFMTVPSMSAPRSRSAASPSVSPTPRVRRDTPGRNPASFVGPPVPRPERRVEDGRVTGVGYRLQLTLVDLVDLTLQTQHVRWNVIDEPEVARRLDEFDALVRAAADEVADRLRSLGVSPDGRIATNYHDLLFDPLPPGPFTSAEGTKAFLHRLAQFGDRLRTSIEYLNDVDEASATMLSSINEEIIRWTQEHPPSVDPAN